MKNKKIWMGMLLLTSAIAAAGAPGDKLPAAEDGKAIFQSQCASCHSVNKQLIGPALANVDQRHTEAWIMQFIRSSQKMVKSGDKQAAELFNKYQIVMPDHPDMTDLQIKSILSYIKSATEEITGDQAPFARPAVVQPDYQPLSFKNYAFIIEYLVLIGILVLVLLFTVRVKEIEKNIHGKNGNKDTSC